MIQHQENVLSPPKTKVAPLKCITSRLELLGCVLLCKLLADVRVAIGNRLKFNSCYGWSDSKVALCWIRGQQKTWKPWVENRVVFIRKVLQKEAWHHVAGEYNTNSRG